MNQFIMDVVIVGGGPSGLSAALVLGRSLRKVLIIDYNHPRNASTKRSHGYLTRDGISPVKFRQLAKEELKKYKTVNSIEDAVIDIEKKAGIFNITTKKGFNYQSRKVIFATGMKDQLPMIPGFIDVYGTSVFPCPYCDGWEHKNTKLAVFGNKVELFTYIKLISHWSKDLMVFTNGKCNLSDIQKNELKQHRIPLIETPIQEVQSVLSQLKKVILTDGRIIRRDGGFVMTNTVQSSNLPSKLGVEMDEKGRYQTKEHGLTNIDGIYIVGDATKGFAGIVGAASDGYETGIKINSELVEENWNKNLK
ncbi:thioredoxin reductase [Bacillus pakistanensis]|uniref:Thioredoxin reductase n=1 Tax=Rossellomorea pakistanensis TaxID=992288 RepID=A0ABS2N7J7_9BACI|nr:NAD(P)/FAD-dependent oxidoreductase [Bacillus pakistanensis]MBM7583808.1 thioredoxin reductase [Bacillus pakistanensis]